MIYVVYYQNRYAEFLNFSDMQMFVAHLKRDVITYSVRGYGKDCWFNSYKPSHKGNNKKFTIL